MRILLFLTILSVFVLASSCEKFLNTTPLDFIAPVNYYKTEDDLNRALTGVYDRLGDTRLYARGMLLEFVFSDEQFVKGQTTGILANFAAASTLEVNRQWEALYTGIERANMLLESMVGADVSEDVYNEVRGQALFLRGYYYFLLVDQYGGVPLKIGYTKTPEEAPLPRASVADVYQQIVKDMQEAEELVKPISYYGFNGRVSRTAVQGLLARVFLTMAGHPLRDESRYADAKAYAEKVMMSGEHELNPDFKQIFINHSREEYDIKEGLWEIELWGDQQGTIREAGAVGIINGIQSTNDVVGRGSDFVHVTKKLWDTYENEDLRRDWTIAPFRYGGGATAITWGANQIYERSCGKWRREYEPVPRAASFNATNFPVLRYADVLLMFAEADNEVSGGPTSAAYTALNQVRRRGYGKPIGVADAVADVPPSLSQAAFREFIRNERMRELSFEAIRKHDLIRWGIYVQAMQDLIVEYQTHMPAALRPAALIQANNGADARSVLLPIPNSEIGVNPNVEQNPGY